MAGVTLEDFALRRSQATESAAPRSPTPALAEQDRAAAYEEGYQAGWDDAAKAQAEDQKRIGAEFARSLRELSFTFHEARAHVIASLGPLLDEVVNAVLPALVADTYALALREELLPLIEDAGDTPVELMVAPGAAALLEGPVADLGAAAVRLCEDASLAEAQAYLRLGKLERQVDLSGALERIRAAVAALHKINERTLKHG